MMMEKYFRKASKQIVLLFFMNYSSDHVYYLQISVVTNDVAVNHMIDVETDEGSNIVIEGVIDNEVARGGDVENIVSDGIIPLVDDEIDAVYIEFDFVDDEVEGVMNSDNAESNPDVEVNIEGVAVGNVETKSLVEFNFVIIKDEE